MISRYTHKQTLHTHTIYKQRWHEKWFLSHALEDHNSGKLQIEKQTHKYISYSYVTFFVLSMGQFSVEPVEGMVWLAFITRGPSQCLETHKEASRAQSNDPYLESEVVEHTAEQLPVPPSHTPPLSPLRRRNQDLGEGDRERGWHGS